MRKKISKFWYRYLAKELDTFVEKGVITEEQNKEMLSHYIEGYGLNFIRVLLTIGAILIGLGFLLFVASNWDVIGTAWKLVIIIGAFTASMVTSFMNEKNHPFAADAFLYLSVLIYGAAIFLIEQMFNLNLDVHISFFIWTIGALVLSTIYKDIILFVFSHFLAFIFISNSFNEVIFIQGILLLAAFYFGNYYFQLRKIITFSSILVTEMFLIYVFDFMNLNELLATLFMFGVGLAMYYVKHSLHRPIFQFLGLATFGITGFMLTFEYIWEEWSVIQNGSIVSIPFAILFIVYLLTLVSRRQITPLIVIGALILRYYFDTFYDYMPRSLFFVVGGVMIMGIGYYIERYRKGDEDEKVVEQ